MGLFDLLSKEGRAKSALSRNMARVVSKYAQSPERFAAMEKLRAEGSEEALYGLMRRFSFKYDKTIEDEQEKEWVMEVMVAKGESALPAVRRYALEADSWGWALRIMEQIGAGEKVLAVIDELLAREEPTYTRDPGRKLEMLSFFAEWKGASDAEIARRIVAYVADFDENVRFQAVEALSHHPDEASSRDAVVAAMLRPEEESKRVKVRCADLLVQTGWPVTARKEEIARFIESTLPDYSLARGDKLQKKGK
jgi:hypothetical protein